MRGEFILALAANFIVAGVVASLKGTSAGAVSFGIGIALFAVWFFIRKKGAEPERSPVGTHPEVKQDASSHVHAPISISVVGGGSSTAAAPAPAPVPGPEPPQSPKLELLSCVPTMIVFDHFWIELNSADIKPQQWKPNAFVVRFRLKPTPVGKRPMFAHNATAHLIYRNDKGETQVVDYGAWLGMYEHKVSFRGNSHSLILSSNTKAESRSDEEQTYVFDNPHSFNIFDNPYSLRQSIIYPPNENLILPNCAEVEVDIRNMDTTLFAGIFDRDGNGWKPRLSKEDQ